MAVESTATTTGPLPADGSATVFDFTFKAAAADEVGAVAYDADGTEVTLPAYTTTLSASGGTVTFDTAPETSSLYLYSDPDFRQQIEFEQGSRWLASPVNEANDRAALRDLWLRDRVNLLSPDAMVAPEGRAGQYLAWDADGNASYSSGTGADAGLRTDLAASGGSALSGFIQVGTGAVARSVQAKARETISAADFGYGKLTNTPAQNTAAIIKAIDVQQTLTGGALHIPYTTNSFVEPIVYDLTVGQPLIMFGDGQSSSVLRKAANSDEPVLTLRSTGSLQAYHHISAMRFDNGFRSPAGIAVKLVDIPRFVFDRCHFHGCATGVRGEGALIGSFIECSALNNDVGYDFTKSAANIHANLISIVAGEIQANKLGMKFDYGTMLFVDRVDIEHNGVGGDTSTGGIHFGTHLSDEAGYAQVFIRGWFEGNQGVTLKGISPGANSTIALDQCLFIDNDEATEVQLSGWKAITLRGVAAPTGTWTTEASDFDSDITSVISTLVDTSTHGPVNLRTATERYYNAMDVARIRAKAYALNTQDLLMTTDDGILGGPTKDIGFAKYGDGEFWLGTTAAKRFRMNSTGIGFFGKAPAARPTGVAVDAASIHAALVTLGLIT